MKTSAYFITLLGLVTCLFALSEGNAQDFPSKPVRIIQPLGPGSPGDLASRAIAQSLSQSLGQPVVVENRVGANGILGMEACVKAEPDGHTLCAPSGSQISLNPVTYAKLPYDPPRDLAPVILVGRIRSSIVVHPSLPVKSMGELIDLARSNPGVLNWGSWGVGSLTHLYLAWLQNRFGVSLTHVPHKTLGAATTAVVAGEVQVMQTTPGLALPLAKAGKLRVLAVTGEKRSVFLPEVPSFKELGYDLQFESWIGMFAPKDTPKKVVQLLNTEIGKLVADSMFSERFLKPAAIDAGGGSAEEFAKFLTTDRETAAMLVKMANLRPE